MDWMESAGIEERIDEQAETGNADRPDHSRFLLSCLDCSSIR
jgi:hypothetical protein